MDVRNQRLQFLGELHVVMWAAQPPLIAELEKRDAAHVAGFLVQCRELVGRLADAQLAEHDELAALKRQKYAEMENFEAWAASQVEKVERRVRILESELRLLAEDSERKERLHKEGVARLEEELQRAERQRVVAQGEEDDDRLACPVCLELLWPPLRVFQCPEGHILCENCKVSYICNVHFKKYFSKAFKVSCIKGIVSQDFLGQQMMLMDTA